MIIPALPDLRLQLAQLMGAYFLALSLPLAAQQAGDGIKLRFSVCAVALSGELSELHLPLAKATGAKPTAWLKVPLNETTVGAPMEYRGPAALRFFAAPGEGTKPVATMTVATTAKSILLVFLPDPATGGYKVIPVDDAEFVFGSYYFHNLSPHAVAIDLGGRKQVLKPGGKAVMAVPPAEDQEVKIHASINGAARLIKSTSWRIDADQRELVFFYTPPGGEMVLTKHLMSSKVATPAGK
jgi:hypothetical protein